MKINEYFGPTVQGEGLSVGKPCLFLRLAGCNLGCTFCDSAFTWNYEGTEYNPAHSFAPKFVKTAEVHDMQIKDIALKLFELSDNKVRHLVITGGEPLLQQKDVFALMKCLPGWSFEIETNGTISPLKGFEELNQSIQYNISPKLSNSGNKVLLRRKLDVLNEFASRPTAYFKFVFETDNDIDEIESLINNTNISRSKVFLMPLGHTKQLIEQNREKTIRACIENNFRYSPRLQVETWDTKRKV